MRKLTILYDEPQEADWFRSLHPELEGAGEESINDARRISGVIPVLAYDRPDIILLDDKRPILVVEETVEVPSGHNVGQRFARIAASAEAGVPSFYFGPYVAKKHGGETAGPRYMNLRLFFAFEALIHATGAAVTTINWPVDGDFEVRRDRDKDRDARAYMNMFLQLYDTRPREILNQEIIRSDVHARLIKERMEFAAGSIRNPEQYDSPPNSVAILRRADFVASHAITHDRLPSAITEIIRYEVGMTYIRSDPYTGMALLYKYLYVVGKRGRALVLWFPNITIDAWTDAASRGQRKDIRLFRIAADAIVFADGYRVRGAF